ncbi:MAG: DUF4332 domain-containing protein [Henriciella sp.]|uniref:DUF4332 domain-containing protein n=1 Tax=Henriciella sp. TaxID=1968823 RepID=UPI003C766AB5
MTSLLQDVIVAHRCRSTHHFMAMEALDLIDGPDAEDWRNLLLSEHSWLLQGAKAPDAEFKDFRNHVLHVSDGGWGGARDAASEWYGRSVEALRAKKWSKAAYALGVMSHYFSDPCQPFHTGQTEEEGSIHRALEWSIAKSRDEISRRIEVLGYPKIKVGTGPTFVADMVLDGARRSHPHYQTFIDHYDIHAGVKNPPAGLDGTLLDTIADLCAYATKGIAILYVRAIKEARVKPKKVNLTLKGYLAQLDIPVRWVTKKLDNIADQRTVAKMYKELQETGKVIKSLPDDDKAIRKMHARDVLRVPLEQLDAVQPKPTGTKHVPLAPAAETPAAPEQESAGSTPATDKTLFTPERAAAQAETSASPVSDDPSDKTLFIDASASLATAPEAEEITGDEVDDAAVETEAEADTGFSIDTSDDADTADDVDDTDEEDIIVADDSDLTPESNVVDAPSIGPKTAERLAEIDIETVADLLEADPIASSDALDSNYMTPEAIADWQDQARLKMAMPSLRVHDVQILVGAGFRSVEAVADASAADLLKASMAFVETPEARRMISGKSAPDSEEIEGWIGLARDVS